MQLYESVFLKHSDNVKRTWSGIKTIIKLKAIAKASSKSLTLHGQSITNKTSIAETFSICFANIGPSLAFNIPKRKNSFNSYLKNIVINSFL